MLRPFFPGIQTMPSRLVISSCFACSRHCPAHNRICVNHSGRCNVSAATMEKSSVLTGRQLMLLVVIGLHALAIGGLMTMRIVVDAARPPAAFKAVTTIDDPTPPPQPPPVLEPGEIVPTWVVPSVA